MARVRIARPSWGYERVRLRTHRARVGVDGNRVLDPSGDPMYDSVKVIDGLRRVLAHDRVVEMLETVHIGNYDDSYVFVAVSRVTDDQTADRLAVHKLIEGVWFGDPSPADAITPPSKL